MDRNTGGAAVMIVQQLAALCEPGEPVPMYPMLIVRDIESRPWASATFDGERHLIRLRIAGSSEQIGDTYARLVELLPSHEFDIPGQLVAECKVIGAQSGADFVVIIEALTVVD